MRVSKLGGECEWVSECRQKVCNVTSTAGVDVVWGFATTATTQQQHHIFGDIGLSQAIHTDAGHLDADIQ